MPLRQRLVRVAFVVLIFTWGLLLGRIIGPLPAGLDSRLPHFNESRSDTARRLIDHYYYRPPNRRRLDEGAIEGMVAALNDPFSAYFSPQHFRQFRRETSGRYSGIGVELLPARGGFKITAVTRPSPAAKAGIRPGDVLLAIDGRSLADHKLISLPANRPARLLLLDGQQRRRELSLRAARLTRRLTTARLLEGQVGWLRLDNFYDGAGQQLRRQATALEQRGARSWLLDLRGNGGGLIDEVGIAAGIWLTNRRVATVSGRRLPHRSLYSQGQPLSQHPLLVLVDGQTASAAEILTAALQDYRRARVVGSRTFGKGVVGEVFSLPGGGALDLVVGEYRTPQGRSLIGRGITPDVPVSDNPQTKKDEVLKTALGLLKQSDDG